MAGIHSGPTHAFIVPQVLCGVCNTSLKGNLPSGRVGIDKVGLGAHNVDNDVVVYVLLEFKKPLDGTIVRGGGDLGGRPSLGFLFYVPRVHRNEGLLGCNVVAKDTDVTRSVIKLGYAPAGQSADVGKLQNPAISNL